MSKESPDPLQELVKKAALFGLGAAALHYTLKLRGKTGLFYLRPHSKGMGVDISVDEPQQPIGQVIGNVEGNLADDPEGVTITVDASNMDAADVAALEEALDAKNHDSLQTG